MTRAATRTILALIGLLAFCGLAACAPTASVSTAATAISATATTATTAPATSAPATATTSAACTLTPEPLFPPPSIPFSLPPHTVWKFTSGAAGAGFFIACTLGATQATIDTFLNATLLRAGWQQWNPQTEDANGCGTEPNDYWRWSKSGTAVGWSFTGPPLPSWLLTICDLAYGH